MLVEHTDRMSVVVQVVIAFLCILKLVQGCANTGGNNRREAYYQSQYGSSKESDNGGSKYRYVRSVDDADIRYTLHEEEVNWFAANDRCNREASHLVVVNSEEEAEKISRLLSPNRRYHAGFQDLSQEGQYVTVTGYPLEQIGYRQWSTEEPSRGSEEDCGALDGLGKLSDVNCHEKLYFICEARSPGISC